MMEVLATDFLQQEGRINDINSKSVRSYSRNYEKAINSKGNEGEIPSKSKLLE
jgi:hypothetical protein